jgi:uncharacterized protein YbjQ (UPF0145 family)
VADKDDLTRLEDLSEYLHEEDPEADELLKEEDPPEDFPPEFTSDEPSEEEGPPDFGSPEKEPDEAFPSEEEVNFQESSYEEDPPEFGEPSDAGESSFEETSDSQDSSFEETPDSQDSSFEETPDSQDSSFEEDDGQWQVETAPEVEDNEVDTDQETFAPLPEEEVPQDVQENSAPQDFIPPQDDPLPPKEEIPLASAGPPKTYEHFQEVKSFAENMVQTKLGSGANPPYSLIIREIKSKADANAIFGLLEEHGFVSPQNKKGFEIGLEQNNLLVSHISEFSAIYIAHKIRRHCYQILFGLSDELRPSKHYEPSPLGQVGRDSIYQDKSFEEDLEKISQDGPIIITNSPILEDYKIMRYLGIATEHAVVDHSSIISDSEEETEESLPSGLKDLYDSLALKLKPLARAQKGNAIVGVNYQLTPLPPKPFGSESPQYSLTCTGNIVRVAKRENTFE